MLEERDLLRSTVRRCILRKRVSFAFFKQWYWDCFDEDVQVCLTSQSALQAQMLVMTSILRTPPGTGVHSGLSTQPAEPSKGL